MATPEEQREYQRNWRRRRRQAWLDANGPCVDCGSADNLEVDHRDYREKVTHNVWNWPKERRDIELAKCVVRCVTCHLIKTKAEHAERFSGEGNANAVLTAEIVADARRRYEAGGYTWKELGVQFGVKGNTLRKACNYFWKNA